MFVKEVVGMATVGIATVGIASCGSALLPCRRCCAAGRSSSVGPCTRGSRLAPCSVLAVADLSSCLTALSPSENRYYHLVWMPDDEVVSASGEARRRSHGRRSDGYSDQGTPRPPSGLQRHLPGSHSQHQGTD